MISKKGVEEWSIARRSKPGIAEALRVGAEGFGFSPVVAAMFSRKRTGFP
jgi:hypothetical protein